MPIILFYGLYESVAWQTRCELFVPHQAPPVMTLWFGGIIAVRMRQSQKKKLYLDIPEQQAHNLLCLGGECMCHAGPKYICTCEYCVHTMEKSRIGVGDIPT